MAIKNVASIFRVARRALISLSTVLAEKELMVLEFILLTLMVYSCLINKTASRF